ncbi:MAG TPA: hypothetical protein VF920_12545, partial [Dongiaceae bacterium]
MPPVTDAALGRLTPTGSGSVQRWLLLAGFLWRHEARLARRDLVYLLTAGHRWHLRSVLLVGAIGFVLMHLIAYGMVGRQAGLTLAADVGTYISLTGTIILSFFLLLSQALERVTRLFYGQGDLDLIAS